MSHATLLSRKELAAGALRRVLFATLPIVASWAMLVSLPASADPIGDLKAQAAAMAQRLVQDRLEIDGFQQQYTAISQRVDAEGRALAAIDTQVGNDQQKIVAATQTLQAEALHSYMTAGSDLASGVTSLFAGNRDVAEAAQEYTDLASGDIQSAIDHLRSEQRTLQADRSSLQVQQAQDHADQGRRAAAFDNATATAHQLAAEQSQVTGQLAAAVARQAAAQAAAARSALAAAQKAAIKPTAPGAPSSQSGSDPALNSFLQCVVQAESGGNYQAVSPGGLYMGAFQFSQSTWNLAAQAAGRPDLIGVPPNTASKADQDTLAVTLYALDGQQPWLGDRC